MDTKSPDNDALHEQRFRQIVAYAIRDGLHAWTGVPLPPDDSATDDYGGNGFTRRHGDEMKP
jgi:hypothetical protein